MDPTTVYASMKSASVHIINFINPLQFGISITVLLSGKDLKNFFLLHKKADKIFLKRGQSTDIPIMFAPEEMYKHSINIAIVAKSRYSNGNVVAQSESLVWEYPIFGQPELRLCSNDDAPTITCHAKEQLQQVIGVTLVKSLNYSGKVFFQQQGKIVESGVYSLVLGDL